MKDKNYPPKYVSVFIPVFNGIKYLGECIDSVLNQELPENYRLELIVIDSGSTDGSVELLKSYGSSIEFSEIPNSDFGHGKTRQKAAEISKGEFILFLTQDATPTNSRWLINMVEPFFMSEKIGCVLGRQIPRADAVPIIKREILAAFAGIGAPDSISVQRNRSLVDNTETNQINTFFSDVNSAVRKSLLLGKVPFRNLPYAEDQALAKDMQLAGYLKGYAPQGSVMHSNEYTAREFYKRKFDEYIGLQESVGYSETPSKKNLLLGWIIPTFRDCLFVIRDGEYGKRVKLKWLALLPIYNINLVRGKYDAIRFAGDPSRRAKNSLEHTARNK